jgi:hypothetical protein
VVAREALVTAKGRSTPRTGAPGSPSLRDAIDESLKYRAEAHCSALEAILDEMKLDGSEDLDALRKRLAALIER